jgi:hypothetical protein
MLSVACLEVSDRISPKPQDGRGGAPIVDATEQKSGAETAGELRRDDCRRRGMARIRTRLHGERLHLTITGVLTAADMRRLEHACGAALTRYPPALDIDLRRVTAIDATASAVLHRLGHRGARISLPPAGAPPSIPRGGASTTRMESW